MSNKTGLKKISPAQLVPMDLFEGDFPLRVDLAYAQDEPKSFCGKIYRPGARLWLHEDMAKLVLLASRLCHERYGYKMVLYDGLRTTSAQEMIRNTKIVQENPHWLEGDTRLLSPPGRGAHPRGMAIDLSLETDDGKLLDMGTKFDELATNGPGPATNRAHRDYKPLPPEVLENRRILTECMTDAAGKLGLKLVPLPQEWWDFRFPAEVYEEYAPVSDDDLPPQMKMTDAKGGNEKDLPSSHFEGQKKNLPKLIV